MVFKYSKSEKLDLENGRKSEIHRFEAEGSDFAIEASAEGFRIVGTSPWIIPVEGDGQHHMPEDIRSLASVLDQAAKYAWQESKKFRCDDIARKRIVDTVH